MQNKSNPTMEKILEEFETWWDSFRPTEKLMPDFYDIKRYIKQALTTYGNTVREGLMKNIENMKVDLAKLHNPDGIGSGGSVDIPTSHHMTLFGERAIGFNEAIDDILSSLEKQKV